MSITKSVIETNVACSQKDVNAPANAPDEQKYPYLVLKQLRTVGSSPLNPIVPITDLSGRTNGYGKAFKFDTRLFSSYEELKMRRKAEYLKFKKNSDQRSNAFSNTVSNPARNIYSSSKLRQIAMVNRTLNCDNPVVLSAPTNSGIVDPNFAGYYLSKDVPFLQYL